MTNALSIPVVFAALVWVRLTANAGRRWRRSLLEAATLLGAGTILTTELLGLAHLVRPAWVSLFWAIVGLVGLIYLGREWLRPSAVRQRVVARARGFSWAGLRRSWTPAELFAVGLVLGVTGIIAWLAPPTNYDSMTYQFPRVMHWFQQGTLAHYPTSNLRQLAYGPGAAYWQTQLWSVFNGDAAANLPQWAAFVGCAIALTVWLQRFVDRRALGLAVVTALTLPMALLQASSTQTDLQVGCWIVIALVFLSDPRPVTFSRTAFTGLAIGLAVVTKPSAVLCVAPLAIAGLWQACRNTSLVTVMANTAACLAISLAINLPHFLRNVAWFGNPLGTDHGTVVESLSPRLAAANGLRWLALSVPSTNFWESIAHLLPRMGIDPNAPEITFFYSRFSPSPAHVVYRFLLPDEDFIGYTSTLLLVGALGFARFFLGRGAAAENPIRPTRSGKIWGGAIGAALLLHLLFLKWQWWGNRLLLPWALLGFPWLIAFTGAWRHRWLRALTVMALLAQATFVLAFSLNRPLVPLPATWNFVGTKPLLSESRDKLFYTGYNAPPLALCEKVVEGVRQSHARRVGLYVDENFPEYVLWRSLHDAGFDEVELYHLNAPPPTGRAVLPPSPSVDFSVRLALPDRMGGL